MKIIAVRGAGVIAPFVIDGYIRAFRMLGHEVVVYDVAKEMCDDKKKSDILNFKPDFSFGYGLRPVDLPGAPKFFRKHKIKVVCLHYDNPYFGMNDDTLSEIKEYSDSYIHFVWDKYIRDVFADEKIGEIYSTMLAADTSIFYPGEEVNEEAAICFVGGTNIEKLKGLPTDIDLANEFIDDVIEMKLQYFGVPALEIAAKLMGMKKYILVLHLYKTEPLNFWKGIYSKIHGRGSIALRNYIINCIDGVDLHLYGDNVIKKERVILHPYVSYEKELRNVYKKYKLNLNITAPQLETSVNNRVFDCFASGAFILSDYRKEMEDIFTDHWKEITYKNLNELGEKGEYWMAHDRERKELTRELSEVIRNSHTYIQRAEEILKII